MSTPARRPWTHALAVLIALIGARSAAPAQRASDVASVEPRWVAVTADDTPMRCGDLDRYYAIAKFPGGTLLQVDAESADWVQVRYPASLTPFVPVGDGREAPGGAVELTEPSGLRAPSVLMGLAGSWKSVYDPPLPAGTKLKVVERLTNASGEVTGYRVEAPVPPAVKTYAHGFLRRAGVRNATASEVERHLAALRGDEPAPDATPKPDIKPEAKPEPAAATDDSLLEPMTKPGDEPPAAPGAVPDIVGKVDLTDATPTPAGEPAPDATPVIEQGGAQGDEPATDVTPKPVPVEGLTPAELKDLEASFESARKLPREELDVALDELIAEYRRARAEMKEPVVAKALDQRIDWLQLRIDTRNERRRLASTLAQVDQRETELQTRVEQWKASRSFTIVGRLLPSRVYDGVRLPLMYRVESVEPLSYSRTIGYIRPKADDDLARYTGQVVGIRGVASFDRELRMNIIEPREVDVLRTDG